MSLICGPQVPAWGAIFLSGLVFISDGPEIAPSAAAEMQRLQRHDSAKAMAAGGIAADRDALRKARRSSHT